jgi:hypothetical protein
MTGAEAIDELRRRSIAHCELARRVVELAEAGRVCEDKARKDELMSESIRLSHCLNAELLRTNEMARRCHTQLGVDLEIVSLVMTNLTETVRDTFMRDPRRLGRVPTVCAN